MPQISDYDFTAHERYAWGQSQMEAFNKQYHIPPQGAGSVAVQSQALGLVPTHSATDSLMQTYVRKTWSFFLAPFRYFMQRLSSSKVAPSLGSRELLDAEVLKIRSFLKQQNNPKLDGEGEAIIQMIDFGIIKTNNDIDYITSRMKQFIQA